MRTASSTAPGRHARRARVLAVVAVLLAAGAVVGIVLDAGGPAGGQRPSAAGVPAQGSPELDALLHDHAAALLHRNRAAFAAGLSGDLAASGFRATQLAMFDHTDGVPFASFDLSYDRTVVDPPSVAAARTRLGDATAGIVRADLDYAFAGVDARPATHVVYLTLVHTAGGWRLAGDTDLATAGGPSWRGPWDFGPLVVARGGSGLVLLHPDSEDVADVARAQQLAAGIASDLDAAIGAVSSVWGTGWPRRVAVVVAATQPEMDAVAGPGYALGSVAAVAAAEPTTAVTGGPDAAAGQRVVLSGPAVPTLSPIGRSVLLRHELTHVATRDVTATGMPTWVVEGFADYVGNLAGAQPARTVAAELVAQVAAAGVPAQLPADASFVPPTATATATGNATGGTGTGTGSSSPADGPTGEAPGSSSDSSTGAAPDGSSDSSNGGSTGDDGTSGTAAGDRTAAAAYEQAWYAFRTVAALGGPAAPAAFYRAVAAAVAQGTDAASAVDAALRTTTGTGTTDFTARWRAAVVAELS